MSRFACPLSLPVRVRARLTPVSFPILLGAGLALAVAGCGGQASPGPAGGTPGKAGGASKEAVSVAVQAAREAALERTVTVTGTLAAEDQVAMGFQVAGRIETIAVDLGSRVATGQTIARLAPVDFQLRVQQAEAAVAAWLRQGIELDAIFGGDDEGATGAIQALQRAGKRVPEDVAVAGFDDVPFARLLTPPLTTVRAPIELAGQQAASQLIALIQGGEAESSTLLPTELIVRRSCGCV